MVTVETEPVWNSSSFLIYTGGLTVLQAASAALIYLAASSSGAAGEMTAWSLLIFVILSAIAFALRRADRWLAAGIFAFNSVISWGILVAVTLYWWGAENGSFHNFRIWSWSRLLLEVLVLVAATVTRWHFKFPFIRLISAAVGALFVIDLVTKGHGNSVAVVALLLGLLYFAAGTVTDKPSTFWLHLAAGLLIGVPILYWAHDSTFDFTVIAFMSLVYVIWAYWTKRSTWAVFGTVGFFIVATYFVAKAVEDNSRSAAYGGGSPVSGLWFIPLAIGLLGFWLVLLGMLARSNTTDRTGPVTTETKPAWNSSSFLVYAGGLTVLLGAAVGLVYLGYEDRGGGARAGWTLLFLAIVYGIAHGLRVRGRWLAAGIFAFVSVLVWATLVLLTMRWIGWHPFNVFNPYYGGLPFRGFHHPGTPFSSWSWSRMLFWILVLVAAWYDRRVFKFPFIRLISAVVFWFFLADLLTTGRGTWFEIVALLTGLAYLLIGNLTDKPSAFWLHVVGAELISGAVIHWFHTGDGDFAVISIVALVFVLVGYWTERSVWTVFGTVGFIVATYHYLGVLGAGGPFGLVLGASQECTSGIGTPLTCTSMGPSISPWAPAVAFGLLGFWLVGLGLLGNRRGRTPTTVVAETPAPATA
jgi:hypothetical protein